MFRLASQAMILQPHVTILRLYSSVQPTMVWLNTRRNTWSLSGFLKKRFVSDEYLMVSVFVVWKSEVAYTV